MTDITVATPAADTMQADKYRAAFVWVDPTIASRWLERNDRNRVIQDQTVARYARDMDACNWVFTGEAVKFADDGRLLDGQQRLTAIVATGCTILMLVVRGLDSDAQKVMDTGRKRTAGDALHMDGHANYNALAAAARLVVAYHKGAIKTSNSQFLGETSNSEILSLTDSDPLVSWAVQVARHHSTMRAKRAGLALAAWVAGSVDADSATSVARFINETAQMQTTGKGDPRHTLLTRFAIAKEKTHRLTSVEEACLTLRSWDAYRRGERLFQLKLSSASGPMPFPVLKPLA